MVIFRCLEIFVKIEIYFKNGIFITGIFIIFNKFAYMAHHFIMLWLNPLGLWVDREEWWFNHSVSQLRVCLSAENVKNISWPWLSPLRGWGSLTLAFTGKFVYIYICIYI